MKTFIFTLVLLLSTYQPFPPKEKKETKGASDWHQLFAKDLSNATYPEGVWKMEKGILTATEDKAIWTNTTYENFELKLEFKNDEGTNSGVFVYADPEQWLSNSVEIQIADDYFPKWANSPKSWQCAAIFGHQPAVRTKIVKKPGAWNKFRIVAKGQLIKVYLNGTLANELDMAEYTSSKVNPDGTEVLEWLTVPLADLETSGHIGLQGKHAGKPIWFRNLKVRQLD